MMTTITPVTFLAQEILASARLSSNLMIKDMEVRGFEPLTFSLRTRRSTN